MHTGKKGFVKCGLHACTGSKLIEMVGRMRDKGLRKRDKLWLAAVCELVARTTEVWLDARVRPLSRGENVPVASLREAFESAQVETMFQHPNLSDKLGGMTLRKALRMNRPFGERLADFALRCVPEAHEPFKTALESEINECLVAPRGACGRIVSQRLGTGGPVAAVAVDEPRQEPAGVGAK